jgi:hypothetical protein
MSFVTPVTLVTLANSHFLEKGDETMARWRSIRPECTDLVMPLVPGELLTGRPTRVTAAAPKALYAAVDQLGRLFQYELGYCEPWHPAETPHYRRRRVYRPRVGPGDVAFLWPHPEAQVGSSLYRDPVIGACYFAWGGWSDEPPVRLLQWVWLHPYFRRRGLLRDAWPGFRAEFGDFQCEPPLSDAMRAFLATQAGVVNP